MRAAWERPMQSELTRCLKALPIFASLSEVELERIQDTGRVEYYGNNAPVLSEGESGPRMVVILEGSVDVLRSDSEGNLHKLAHLTVGEVIGEMSLLLDLPRTATVRACDDIRVFAMDRAAFEQLVEDGDVAALKFGMALSRVLASRVVDLNSKLVALARERGESVPESRESVGLSEDFMGWWDTYS